MLDKERVRNLIYSTDCGLRAIYGSVVRDAKFVEGRHKTMTGTCPFCRRPGVFTFGVEKDWWKCSGKPTCTPGRFQKNVFDLIIRCEEKENHTRSFGWALAAVVNTLRMLGYAIPADIDEEMRKAGWFDPDEPMESLRLPPPALLIPPPPVSRRQPAEKVETKSLNLRDRVLGKLQERPYSTTALRTALRCGRPELMDLLDTLAAEVRIIRVQRLDERGRRNHTGPWTVALPWAGQVVGPVLW